MFLFFLFCFNGELGKKTPHVALSYPVLLPRELRGICLSYIIDIPPSNTSKRWASQGWWCLKKRIPLRSWVANTWSSWHLFPSVTCDSDDEECIKLYHKKRASMLVLAILNTCSSLRPKPWGGWASSNAYSPRREVWNGRISSVCRYKSIKHKISWHWGTGYLRR